MECSHLTELSHPQRKFDLHLGLTLWSPPPATIYPIKQHIPLGRCAYFAWADSAPFILLLPAPPLVRLTGRQYKLGYMHLALLTHVSNFAVSFNPLQYLFSKHLSCWKVLGICSKCLYRNEYYTGRNAGYVKRVVKGIDCEVCKRWPHPNCSSLGVKLYPLTFEIFGLSGYASGARKLTWPPSKKAQIPRGRGYKAICLRPWSPRK